MRSPSMGAVEDSFSAHFHLSRLGRKPDDALPVEGLRMSQVFEHRPVMVEQVVDLLAPVPDGTVIDATVGGGGHARAVLEAHPHLRVVAMDRDPAAVAAASATLAPFGGRAAVVRARFDRLTEVAAEHGLVRASGVLFDLGVSSAQLDVPARGFAYRHAAPLDMRMDPGELTTAADLANTMTEAELTSLFARNGEGRFARRLARAVVSARPLSTTTQLAEVVREAIPAPARRQGGHPARRVFQALRIEVNQELSLLAPALDEALALLAPLGRCLVLSYHSGEDRIVKQRFAAEAARVCTCPPGMPCTCGAPARARLVQRKPLRPTPEEVAANRRAESARLRVIERAADATAKAGARTGPNA
jgi:16S rRNA (cytosine1402-N4)-methyltransferase